MDDVPLEVPLRLLPLRRRSQRDHAGCSRVERLGDSLDRSALARRVAALEDHQHLEPAGADELLLLDQLDLQARDLLVVVGGADLRGRLRCFLDRGPGGAGGAGRCHRTEAWSRSVFAAATRTAECISAVT